MFFIASKRICIRVLSHALNISCMLLHATLRNDATIYAHGLTDGSIHTHKQVGMHIPTYAQSCRIQFHSTDIVPTNLISQLLYYRVEAP